MWSLSPYHSTLEKCQHQIILIRTVLVVKVEHDNVVNKGLEMVKKEDVYFILMKI